MSIHTNSNHVCHDDRFGASRNRSILVRNKKAWIAISFKFIILSIKVKQRNKWIILQTDV